MGFEQGMEDLQHNSLVDSKLGNDVGEEKVTMIAGRWVDTVLGEQAEGFSANLLAKEYLRNCSGPLTRRTLSS